MSDSDYIPWKYRDTKRADQIDKSHAVADSVMRELADQLFELAKSARPFADGGNLEYDIAAADAALARFDALGGNDE